MYVGQLEMKLPDHRNTGLFRCGKNLDFDIDKHGWVWPNAVKGKNCSKVFLFQSSISLSKLKKISIFQMDYVLDLGDTIVLECENDPNCLQLNGELSVFDTWGTGKNLLLLYYFSVFRQRGSGKYKLDMDVYHRDVKPIFLTKFRTEYGTKKFNDMYVFLLQTQVAP